MDTIVCSALEEICAEGPKGVPVPKLWVLLEPCVTSSGLDLCDGVKKAIWARLGAMPELRFELGGSPVGSGDSAVASCDEAEKSGMRIVAEEQMRYNFLGIYVLKAGGKEISSTQKKLLERIAIARTHGITQSQICKEMGIKGNDMFYYLRGFEVNGLIVRQSTIVKTGGNREKNTSTMRTNIVYLYRYARLLSSSSLIRVEITKEDICDEIGDMDGNSWTTRDGYAGEQTTKECVQVKDYLPALEAICNKLEEASGKVLVVSDIKKDLGYRGTKGNRAWRNIINRLKEANLVEEFHAKVNSTGKKRKIDDVKPSMCLRLIKKFSPKDFQPKNSTCGYEDYNLDKASKCNRNGPDTEQLVEMPIEHQIYDIIEAEGSKGVTIPQVCDRLGLNCKKYYSRIVTMSSRFGVHIQAENHNRTKVYRLRTIKNVLHDLSLIEPSDSMKVSETDSQVSYFENPSSDTISLVSSSKELSREKPLDVQIPVGDSECLGHVGDNGHQVPVIESELKDYKEVSETGSTLQKSFSTLATQKIQSCQRHPCLTITTLAIQRTQRILSRLQNEKFILVAEMHKWLKNLETENHSKMDKKTLVRMLKTLSQEGKSTLCKIGFPSLTAPRKDRDEEVILHPSISSISEISNQVYKRSRDFNTECRIQGFSQIKSSDPSITLLTNIERSSKDDGFSRGQCEKTEPRYPNGFVQGKMVRTKLFHTFLWSYVCGSPDEQGTFSFGKNCVSDQKKNLKTFAVHAAVKAMPFELFLQVVGCTEKSNNLIEHWRCGLRLSDLPVELCYCLTETYNVRLLSIIDILIKMKLIHLVMEESLVDARICQHVVLSHALEIRPCIEVPRGQASLHSSHDYRPRLRHDFNFSNFNAVDAYWQKLESYYAAADPTTASHAFPGSVVREVFAPRSWSSAGLTSLIQRMDQAKNLAVNQPDKKMIGTCSGKGNQHPALSDSQPIENENQREEIGYKLSVQKRKRSLKQNSDDTSRHRGSKSPKTASGSEADGLTVRKMTSSLMTDDYDDHINGCVEFEIDNDDGKDSFINHCALSRFKVKRQRKFLWNDELDRQLLIQYARHRATRGAKFYRADWASISDLPAQRSVCKKRMAMFMKIDSLRIALMGLCNILGERYVKYLRDTEIELHGIQRENSMHANDGISLVKHHDKYPLIDGETIVSSSLPTERWDDFGNANIKMALDKVIQCSTICKMEISKKNGFRHKKKSLDALSGAASDRRTPALRKQKKASVSITQDAKIGHAVKRPEAFKTASYGGQNKLSHDDLPGGVLSNRNRGITPMVVQSLAISSAVELLKLVFLTTSAASEVQALLAETLRRYSKGDLFEAFKYLRDKNFVVTGHGSLPFVLSQKFIQNASSSPFPIDSANRVSRFSAWLHQQGQTELCDDLAVSIDLQCGETFHLLALVFSGDFYMSVRLPEEGVGEADGFRNSKQKDKATNCDRLKKHDFLWVKDSDFCLRREKGFPGIKITLKRISYSQWECVDHFANVGNKNCHIIDECAIGKSCYAPSAEKTALYHENENFDGSSRAVFHSASEVLDFESRLRDTASYAEKFSPKDMSQKQDIPISSDLIKSVYIAIKHAGELGLNMEEIAEIETLRGTKHAEFAVNILEVSRLVMKVNAYDCVRVVDSLYKSKYFIALLANDKDLTQSTSMKSKPNHEFSKRLLSTSNSATTQTNSDTTNDSHYETEMDLCDGHKVMILDFPERLEQYGTRDKHAEDKDVNTEKCHQVNSLHTEGNSCICRPILPWLNGDGSTNTVMYKALVRRILGIIMQNPGILEDGLISHMDILNPQSCREFLKLMILDKHIITKRIFQTLSCDPPTLLQVCIKQNFTKSVPLFRTHLFANPLSTYHL